MGTFVNQAKATPVGVLGFDGAEFHLIRNVLKISTCRPQGGYEIHVGVNAINCELLIANVDDSSAMASLQSVSGQERSTVKLLVSSTEPVHSTSATYCMRPLSPVKLLKLLDQLVLEKRLHEPAHQIFSGKETTEPARTNDCEGLVDPTSTTRASPKSQVLLMVFSSSLFPVSFRFKSLCLHRARR